MYAKLVFQTGTDYTLINRDIVRCITNSDGAGGSTLGALENIVLSSSSISDTEASNWSLAAGQTLSTGTSVEQDKRFYLQQAHANGSTRTVALQTAFRDTIGFTNANDATYSGVHLCPVSDYGESYEAVWHSVKENESPSSTDSPWNRVTGQEVHIIARNKMIFIAGIRVGYIAGTSYCMIFEADAAEVREGRNKPGQVIITGCMSPSTDYDTDSFTSLSKIIDITSANPFGGDHQKPAMCSFVDVLHDYETSQEIRYAGSMNYAWHSQSGSMTTASPALTNCCVFRDINDAGGNGTFSYDTSNNAISFRLWGDSTNYWGYGPTGFDWWPFCRNNMSSAASGGYTDISGNPAVFLRPAAPVVGFKRQQWDFSTIPGYYTATSNFSGLFETINDGADDYIAVKLFSSEESTPCAIAVRI